MAIRTGHSRWWGAGLLAVLLIAGTAWAQGKGEQTLTGKVTDMMCGAKHNMATPGMSEKDCVATCIKMGSKYGLIVGDKVYELDGKENDLAKLAGAKATVKGKVDGEKITVRSVESAS